jgi:hypothetical protein
MSGPRFLYNFTAPRLGVELPLYALIHWLLPHISSYQLEASASSHAKGNKKSAVTPYPPCYGRLRLQ